MKLSFPVRDILVVSIYIWGLTHVRHDRFNHTRQIATHVLEVEQIQLKFQIWAVYLQQSVNCWK